MSVPEAIVLVSGGLDSCVSLAWAHRQGWGIRTLHVSYGQRTEKREEQAFHEIADHYEVPAERRLRISIECLRLIGGSSLIDRSMPVEAAELDRGTLPTTYVPFRNTHLLAAAASWAEVCRADRIVIGAVYEDSSGYPDCRPAYYEAFQALLDVAAPGANLQVVTPLLHRTKGQIVRLGRSLDAPLDRTWSCYQATERACGVCDSCALRLKGFREEGIPDPIPYS